MSIHLNPEETNDWIVALQAVQENADNTDSESSSKPFMDAMARFVRDEPRMVVHLLAPV